MLPLDPHRPLFLPSSAQQLTDPRKRTDHLLRIEGAVGMALVEVAYDVADQFVVHHPRHDPWLHWKPNSPRQPRPWAGEARSAPQYDTPLTCGNAARGVFLSRFSVLTCQRRDADTIG